MQRRKWCRPCPCWKSWLLDSDENHSYILSEKLPRTILGESSLLNSSESFSSMPCAQKGVSSSVFTDTIRDQKLIESVIKPLSRLCYAFSVWNDDFTESTTKTTQKNESAESMPRGTLCYFSLFLTKFRWCIRVSAVVQPILCLKVTKVTKANTDSSYDWFGNE